MSAKGVAEMAIVAAAVIIACSGCTKTSWEEMKEQGANLLAQGRELNQELTDAACQVNHEVLNLD